MFFLYIQVIRLEKRALLLYASAREFHHISQCKVSTEVGGIFARMRTGSKLSNKMWKLNIKFKYPILKATQSHNIWAFLGFKACLQ